MKSLRLRSQRGFSLLEMSMVLVIIGVVMSAVTVGTDVLRHSKGQQAFSVFVTGWRDAFSQYVQVVGRVPADTDPPSNIINSASGPNPIPLCGNALSNELLSRGIRIPLGRGLQSETNYLYRASDGSPHQLVVCFSTVPWSIQSGSVTGFASINRHVMVITGITAELALQMDVLVDGSVSARFGQFRSLGEANSLLLNEVAGWGPLESIAGDSNSARNEVTALFEMF